MGGWQRAEEQLSFEGNTFEKTVQTRDPTISAFCKAFEGGEGHVAMFLEAQTPAPGSPVGARTAPPVSEVGAVF